MMMAVDAFNKLEVTITIQYNNRKLLYGLLQTFEVPEEKMNRVILILDKMEKIERAMLVKELTELGLSEKSLQDIVQFLDAQPTLEYFVPFVSENEFVRQGLQELTELADYLAALGIEKQCVFNPFLARGLETYTGTIYEIFLADGAIKSSIGSGGRYDNAIGGLLGIDQSVATVGISFGLDVIYTAFELAGKAEKQASDIDIYIIPIGTEKEALVLARVLRNEGNRVEVELRGKKVRKEMDKANRENIKQTIVLGENEVEMNRYKLKDMDSGEEQLVNFVFKY